MPTITVHLKPSYDIVIEPGALNRLGEITRTVAPSRHGMLISDAQIAEYSETASQSLEAADYEFWAATMIADELHKSLDKVRLLYARMLRAKLDRSSPVIAMGGGIVCDVAGFVAATFMRGLPLIHVPTTLLAMVDASIGGKTGVNWRMIRAAGRQTPADRHLLKNMIGAFHQPRAVIADPETLRTLDPRELRCGLAECIKHGLIADPDLLIFLRDNLKKILSLNMATLTTLIERSARIKVAIVEQDERESGKRAILNLGHTFAHAIESIHELNLKHGEAVSIGLCAAAHVSVLTNRLDESDARKVESIIDAAGLPRRLPKEVETASLISRMGYDKKVSQGKLRLILPSGLGNAEIVSDVPQDIIERAWQYVGAH